MSYQNQEQPAPIRSGWNVSMMLRRGPLTDRKIAKYQKAGWYDAGFKEARRELISMQRTRRLLREGSFVKHDGRMIYSP